MSLERVVERYNKVVSRVGEHVPLRLGVASQVLPQDLLFRKDFHSIELPCRDLSDQIDLSKTAAAKQFKRHKIIRAHLVLNNRYIRRALIIEGHVISIFEVHYGRLFGDRVVDLNVLLLGARCQSIVVHGNLALKLLLTVRTGARLLRDA